MLQAGNIYGTLMCIENTLGALAMTNWMRMNKAAKELGVHSSKISRLAQNKIIKTEKDPLDQRVTLVDMDELKELFNKHDQLFGKSPTQDGAHDETKDAS